MAINGSIQYLGKGRRKPYAVLPPVRAFDHDGNPIKEKPLCYVTDWMEGFAVLTAYKAGKWSPEMLSEFRKPLNSDDTAILRRILADYSLITQTPLKGKIRTFEDVYKEYYDWKYSGAKEYSEASARSTQSAYKNCKDLHDRDFASIRHADLQAVVDGCKLKHASKELIVSLFRQMYAYADIYGYTDKDYSAHVRINTKDDDIHGVPFTDEEIAKLWAHKDEDVPKVLLIMIYSGFRISEMVSLRTDNSCFIGGVKTEAGKNRTVPIHSAIAPLVSLPILKTSTTQFRKDMYDWEEAHGISRHTPHDTRHTFSMLCDRYGVNEYDKKRMMGHKISDITAGTYGHRRIEDLRDELEKIKVT